MPNAINTCLDVMKKNKIGLFIIAYEAENHIHKLINRIPKELLPFFNEIFVFDDASTDRTCEVAAMAFSEINARNCSVYKNHSNQGYGGNQKIGYRYAIEKGHDIVIMLHGDGQYPPEKIPEIIAEFSNENTDAVFASRMIKRKDALRGGMPFYKWLGNIVLTKIENFTLSTHLSEFHTGYRAYRTSKLKSLPFHLNSNDFHFDSEIIIQLVASESVIREISIPTFYGTEICRVPGLKYAKECIKSVIKYRLYSIGIFYVPNLDGISKPTSNYTHKKAKTSLHHHIVSHDFIQEHTAVDIGAANGYISNALSSKLGKIYSIDVIKPETNAPNTIPLAGNLNDPDFIVKIGSPRCENVFCLDVIEHLYSPEEGMDKICQLLVPGGKLFISTANIAFLPMRISLLLGSFSYGKRGILDITHTRLFTISSFLRLLRPHPLKVVRVIGFPPPVIDILGDNLPAKIIDRVASILAKWLPTLFSFSFLVECERLPSNHEVYTQAISKNRVIQSNN